MSAVIAVDDLSAGPEQVSYLLGVLSGCTVVVGSARPVLVPAGSSQRLAGLPAEAALSLLAHDLGRPLTGQEAAAARGLAAAVDGQPLHLKQAAALVRDGSHSMASLARHAAADADALDRLSVDALTDRERRALAVLALTASSGTDVTLSVCDATTQTVAVANVVGESQTQATSTLKAQGLVVSTTADASCGAGDNGDVVHRGSHRGHLRLSWHDVTIGICIATQ